MSDENQPLSSIRLRTELFNQIVDFSPRAIQELKSRVELALTDGDIYLVGNSRDFDQVAEPLFQVLEANITGKGTFWVEENDLPSGGDTAFYITQEYLASTKSDRPDLLFVQALITSCKEVRAMVSRVIAVLPVRNIVIASLVCDDQTRVELENYFFDDSLEPVQVVSLATIKVKETLGRRVRQNFYDDLDDALGEGASAFPKWTRDRTRGLRPAQKPEEPSSPSL